MSIKLVWSYWDRVLGAVGLSAGLAVLAVFLVLGSLVVKLTDMTRYTEAAESIAGNHDNLANIW